MSIQEILQEIYNRDIYYITRELEEITLEDKLEIDQFKAYKTN